MTTKIVKEADDFIRRLSDGDAAKVLASLEALEKNWTETLTIRKLKKKIMELKVNEYRVVFFRITETIHIIDVFRKKSRKTPKQVIKRAEQIYRTEIEK